MNRHLRTDEAWKKYATDDATGFDIALNMRNHAIEIETELTDLKQGWQPIETAPREGVFMAFVPHDESGFQFVAVYDLEDKLRCMMSHDEFTGKATHWRPCYPHPTKH